MTDYELIMKRLEEMKPDYDAGFTSSEREFLESLYYRYYHKLITLTGCSNCYRDAYIILYNKLKREGTMPQEANYVLKSGEIIHTFGSSEFYSLAIPDEVAEAYLSSDEANISRFSKYPEDWKERIAKTSETTKTTRKSRKAKTETL